MLLGVHCSIAGGYTNAFIESERLGIDTFQIFTKNQRQWKEKIVEPEEAETFRKNLEKYKIKTAFSHATYLINLASEDQNIRNNSILSLTSELIRCDALGLKFTVMHPGAMKNSKEDEAIGRIVNALQIVFDNAKGDAKVLLENTAGQGSSIGWKFEHIREIMKRTGSDRVGMCLDTCHAFAAGYDIRTTAGFEGVIKELDDTVGLTNLHAIHLNDSKAGYASRVDRHENIGQGQIGEEAFKFILKYFKHIPKVLETPKENNMDEVNLTLLRKLAKEI